jgi:hypothetical protein
MGPAGADAAVGWWIVALLFSLRFHGAGRIAVLGSGVVVTVILVRLVVRSQRETTLALNAGRVLYTGPSGERVVLAAGERGRVVEVEIDWGLSGRRSRLWLLLNAAGIAIVSLNRDAWDAGQLERLRQQRQLPLEHVGGDHPFTPRPVALRLRDESRAARLHGGPGLGLRAKPQTRG